jgi:hypothetical protein
MQPRITENVVLAFIRANHTTEAVVVVPAAQLVTRL